MKLKVFISSTCYDLGVIRSQLKSFIEKMGYDSILSENNDVFYNPNDHTHESCVKDVANADIVILIIGSRYGGTAIPSLKKLVDFESLSVASAQTKIIEKKEKLSITQFEILKAIESNIPIYTFVEDDVYHDHHVYEQNKDNEEVISKMKFPSIDKKETAPFIFEFINYMRSRTYNNAVYPFSKLDDIEETLQKQWSSLFQSLLAENKEKKFESSQMSQINNQLDDMKALIMSSVNKDNPKEVAKGVLKYRPLINYVDCLLPNSDLIFKNQTWENLMTECGISKIKEFDDNKMNKRRAILKSDGTFFLPTISIWDNKFETYQKEWEVFTAIPKETKQIIVEAVRDSSSGIKDLRYIDKKLEDYIKEIHADSLKDDDLPF